LATRPPDLELLHDPTIDRARRLGTLSPRLEIAELEERIVSECGRWILVVEATVRRRGGVQVTATVALETRDPELRTGHRRPRVTAGRPGPFVAQGQRLEVSDGRSGIAVFFFEIGQEHQRLVPAIPLGIGMVGHEPLEGPPARLAIAVFEGELGEAKEQIVVELALGDARVEALEEPAPTGRPVVFDGGLDENADGARCIAVIWMRADEAREVRERAVPLTELEAKARRIVESADGVAAGRLTGRDLVEDVDGIGLSVRVDQRPRFAIEGFVTIDSTLSRAGGLCVRPGGAVVVVGRMEAIAARERLQVGLSPRLRQRGDTRADER